jgi:hypothetical protein
LYTRRATPTGEPSIAKCDTIPPMFTVPTRRLVLLVACGLLATTSFSQSVNETPQSKQHDLSLQVTILHLNFLTWWLESYPHGAPFATRDKEADRIAAWSPKVDTPPGVVALNTGLGCVKFIVPNGQPQMPDVCGPVDLQASLAMDALREDWENSRSVPNTKDYPMGMLNALRDNIPPIWTQERTLYCGVKPSAQYIDLNDTLQNCTPAQ